ncbi:MAG: hypothetical protein AAF673_04670 [Pseudomonadota bacterium]
MTIMTDHLPHPVASQIERPIRNAPYRFIVESKETHGQINIFIGIPMESNQSVHNKIFVDGDELPLTGVNIIHLTDYYAEDLMVEITLKHSDQSNEVMFEYFRFVVNQNELFNSLGIKVRSSSDIVRKTKIHLDDLDDIPVLDTQHSGEYMANVPYLYLTKHLESNRYLPNAFIIPNGVRYERRFDIIDVKDKYLRNHIVLYKDNTHSIETIIMPHKINNRSFTDTDKKNGEASIVVSVEKDTDSAKKLVKKIKANDDASAKSNDDNPKAKAKTKGSDAM